MEDFSRHPESLTEVKANKAADGGLWTPRDALIAILRALDAGEIKPSQIMIIWAEPNNIDGQQQVVSFKQSSPDRLSLLGMVEEAKELLFAQLRIK